MSHPMTHGYQPTLLSASVNGLVILWMLSFAGEVYGDLDDEGRLYMFRAIGWLVPPFALSCLSLGIQYAFQGHLAPTAKALINAAMPLITFITLILCAFEVRLVLLPRDGVTTADMDFAAVILLSSWSVIILAALVLSWRRLTSTE